MTLLPIVERELREGARRKSTRYIRLVVAAVALLMGLFQIVFIPFFQFGGSTSGSTAFAFMTGYAFVLCLLAGIFVTADCLSEEKREGTLGLLFLTDLRGYDVVLGKLASQLVHLGYALLAIIPAAALPVLLGGVTAGELWRISLALMNLLFFSLAAGIFASSVCRRAGRAMLLTAILLGVVCIAFPILQRTSNAFGLATASDWIFSVGPAEAYFRAMESGFMRAPDRFWTSLGASHAFAWMLIGIASLYLPRSWQDRPLANRTPVLGALRAGNQLNPVEIRSKRNRAHLDTEPLLWLIGERNGIRAGIWAITMAWLVILLGFSVSSISDGIQIGLVSGWIWLTVLKVLFTLEACRFFTETRRAGAFELLLATPLNANKFVSAQWTALRRLFGPAMLLAVGGAMLAVGGVIFIQGGEVAAILGATFLGGILTAFVLVVQTLDFLALGWLGMWLALTMRRPQLAAGATILYVLILPWLTLCYPLFVGFVLDIILIAVFASKLHLDFRQVILSRPAITAVTPGGVS